MTKVADKCVFNSSRGDSIKCTGVGCNEAHADLSHAVNSLCKEYNLTSFQKEIKDVYKQLRVIDQTCGVASWNPCNSHPCQHGGICYSKRALYTCDCSMTGGYVGDHCEARSGFNHLIPSCANALSANARLVTQTCCSQSDSDKNGSVKATLVVCQQTGYIGFACIARRSAERFTLFIWLMDQI